MTATQLRAPVARQARELVDSDRSDLPYRPGYWPLLAAMLRDAAGPLLLSGRAQTRNPRWIILRHVALG